MTKDNVPLLTASEHYANVLKLIEAERILIAQDRAHVATLEQRMHERRIRVDAWIEAANIFARDVLNLPLPLPAALDQV